MGPCIVKYNDWALIFLSIDKHCNCAFHAPEQCDYFKLSHELFHAWSYLKYENIEADEIFTDLVAAVVLKKTAQTPEALKIIQDIISNPRCSYVARANQRQGKYLSMIQDPEKALRNILEVNSGGIIQCQSQ